ncbi:dTDP-4-dehydrorhamnose reductase [Burkholderiaceae bacterium DAT-1]|nr:dTDP-4-dehydrorhamnose reductase [Burkholderiaceae bacterium DAT-1]
MPMKTILLTGSHGQVGYELKRSLQGLGRVIAPTRDALDLSSESSIQSCLSNYSPDLIINPAAFTAVDAAENQHDEAYAINARAPALFADYAARWKIPLIHYSTDYVYSGDGDQPWREDAPCVPQNVYGASKLAGEEAIRASGCAHLILRTSWVYGSRGKNFLLTMLRLGKERSQLSIIDDQFGAPTWCRTLADLTCHIIASQPDWQAVTGTYHLANSGVTTWYGFAEAIFRIASEAGVAAPELIAIPASQYPLPAKRPHNSRLNLDKFTHTFGLTPPDWQAALRMCMAE